MLSVAYSSALYGIDAYTVAAECNAVEGLSSFAIVGLPDMAVKESRQRILNALLNTGLILPEMEITVNLAPADRKKEGSALDLAILAALCRSCGFLPEDTNFSSSCFIGEMSFSGDIRPVRGVLNMALAAKEMGKTDIFVPLSNLPEASAAACGGTKVYGIGSLKELLSHFRRESLIVPVSNRPEILPESHRNTYEDFSQIKGQSRAKRAAEIAAAGGHNLILVGPPGSGKSMLAKRIPTILPQMTYQEAIEATKIHSVSGLLTDECGILTSRPFRSPHHSMSGSAISGGGRTPSPGEISLAHNGVLFLDELPEFNKTAMESLRQPLEDGKVTITRAAGRVTFPSSFMLVCAMNPCKCGYYGSIRKKCTCRPSEVKAYLSKLSGPLLDRIDIQIEMPELDFSELSSEPSGESSKEIRERVEAARILSRRRFMEAGRNNYSSLCNARMNSDDIRRFCALDDSCMKILESSFRHMNMSARAYDRILKVARTIADLEYVTGVSKEAVSIIGGSIKKKHIMEAIQMRTLDKYW